MWGGLQGTWGHLELWHWDCIPAEIRDQTEPLQHPDPALGFMAACGNNRGGNVVESPECVFVSCSRGASHRGGWQRDKVKCLGLAPLGPLPSLNLRDRAVLKHSWGFPRVISVKNVLIV